MSSSISKAKTRILWDLMDFPIPKHLDPEDIYRNIESALRRKGFQGDVSVRVYGDKNTLPPNEKELIEKYELAGIRINLVPEVAGVDYKHVRDGAMVVDVLAIELENPRPPRLNLMVVANVEEGLAFDYIYNMRWGGNRVFFVDDTPRFPKFIESAAWLSEIFPGSTQHVDKKQKMADEIILPDSEDWLLCAPQPPK